jgi:hypothetical protein
MENILLEYWSKHQGELMALIPVIAGAEFLSRWFMMGVMIKRPSLSDKMQKLLGRFSGLTANVFLSTAYIFSINHGGLADVIVNVFYFSGIAGVGHYAVTPLISKMKGK